MRAHARMHTFVRACVLRVVFAEGRRDKDERGGGIRRTESRPRVNVHDHDPRSR